MNSAQWQLQANHLRRAMLPGVTVSLEELLLVHDLTGRLARHLEPSPNVLPRPAAALVLLYPQDGELYLPLTVRSSHLPTHKGQVSLPGGAVDPEDSGPVAAALREAEEELGIPTTTIEVIGTLRSFYIPPSNFMLTPVVGLSTTTLTLHPHPGEVEEAFTIPLRQLLDPATVVTEEWTLSGEQVQVPFFALAGQKVWGATAIALSELVARLRRT